MFFSKFGKLKPFTKYSAQPLESIIQETVAAYCKQHGQQGPDKCDGMDVFRWRQAYHHDQTPVFDEAQICQSMCVTAYLPPEKGANAKTHLIRTYENMTSSKPRVKYDSVSAPLEIWRVGRATRAAPFYFPELKFVELQEGLNLLHTYKDGGIVQNNPAFVAHQDICARESPPKPYKIPSVLLSIGTGVVDPTKDGFAKPGSHSFLQKLRKKRAILQHMEKCYTKGEREHEAMRAVAIGEYTWYKRLNPTGMETMALDEWEDTKGDKGRKTIDRMEDAVSEYIGHKCTSENDDYDYPEYKLIQAAEKLVRQCRAKESHAEFASIRSKRKWDTFIGRFVKGKYAEEKDQPLHSVDLPDDEDLFQCYVQRSMESIRQRVKETSEGFLGIYESLQKLCRQVAVSPPRNNRDVIIKIFPEVVDAALRTQNASERGLHAEMERFLSLVKELGRLINPGKQ